MKTITRSWLVVSLSVLGVCLGCRSADKPVTAAASESGSNRRPELPATGSTTDIDLVKNGVLQQFPSTTVGKAFGGTFQNPQWRSFETAKGQRIVEFTGTIKPAALRSGGFSFTDIYEQEAAKHKDACIASEGLTEKLPQDKAAVTEAWAKHEEFSTDWKQRFDAVGRKYKGQAAGYHMQETANEQQKLYDEQHDYEAKWNAENKARTQAYDEDNKRVAACVDAKLQIRVMFQFVVLADGSGFELGSFDTKPFSGSSTAEVLAFVYR
jgi:hypothetical protein